MDNVKPTNIQRMLPRHFRMLDLTLAGLGRKDIAETLGVSVQTVSNVQSSPLFQDELERRKLVVDKNVDEGLANTPIRAKAILDERSVAAAERLGTLIESNDEAVAHRASCSVLNHVLGGEQSKIRPVVINAEQFQLLQLSLEESKQIREELNVASG